MNKIFYAIGFLPLLVLSCTTEQRRNVTPPAPAPVASATVQEREATLEISGSVVPRDHAVLSSRYPAFVVDVKVQPGQVVRKGTVLVQLDDRDLQAQNQKMSSMRQELQSAVQEAQNHLEATKAQQDLAQSTFEKIKNLYDKKAASKQEFEEAESRKLSAEATYRAAEERLSQVRSKGEQVKSDSAGVAANLNYLRIVAPFDGKVIAVPADEGTFVNPGQTVVELEKSTDYQVAFFLEETALQSVRVGEPLRVVIPTLSPDSFSAKVAEVVPSIDARTRTFEVKADLPQTTGLRAGLSARVLIPVAEKSLWIPSEYLSRKNDVETVMVKVDGDWKRILVKSGKEEEGKLEILAGLNAGEEVGLFQGNP